MKNRKADMQAVFAELSEENKDIMILIAKGHEGGSGSRGRTLYPEEIYDLETGGRL